VYKKTMPINSESEREKAIQGWVYAAFRMDDFINSFIHEFQDELAVHIVSGVDKDKAKQLFCSDSLMAGQRDSKYRVINQMEIEGQVWTVHVASKPTLEARLDHERPRLILLSGIGLSIICSFLVWFLVSGRLRAIQLVEESEERSKLMMQQANESIVLVDKDRRIVDANAQTTKYFGYSLAELLTLRIDDVVPPIESKALAKRFTELMTQGAQRFETLLVKKDGTVTSAEISVQVIPFKGQPYLLGFVRDISEQKRWEAAIKASEEKLRALFELSFEFIGQLAPDGSLVDVNRPLLDFMQTTITAVRGAKLWDVPLFAPDEAIKNILIDAVTKAAAGSTVRAEMTVLRHDGVAHTLDFSLKPLLRDKVMPELLILEARDISERKRTELQLKKYSEELALSNAAKDKFFSIISHDLRGPFHGFLSAAEMLANGASFMNKDAMISLSKSLHTSLQQQFELLNSLLHWSRLQSGKIELLQDIVYLSKDAEKIIASLKLTAKDKSIELVNEIADSRVVYADRNMTQLVLRNLLTNAIKFTGVGGRVTITAMQEDERVKISVTDTGVGMAPEEIKKLFRLDVQHTTTGTASERGSGLGLLLCKEVVEKHGGKIIVESQPMQGSTFSFTLPCTIPQAVLPS
jgi:PAS domain S-box-containing protein